MLSESAQIVAECWTQPQQMTVKRVDDDCAVHVQSNVQPVGLILWPGEYRPGVSLVKFER